MRKVSILILLLLASCSKSNDVSVLEKIKQKGELVVITRESPTTYYKTAEGKMGLEYELASRFADHLGVKLRLRISESFQDLIPMVIRGEAHMAAAGLTITDQRKKVVRFGPVYQTINQSLVYRHGTKRPETIEDILDGHLEVTAGTSHSERLNQLAKAHPDLQWKEQRGLSSNELLNLVNEEVIDYTIADSNVLSLYKRYNKEVTSAFDISEPQNLAWAMPYHTDDSLLKEANTFFSKLEKSGELAQLIERYYGHADLLNFVGTRFYLRHTKTKLPRFKKQFEKAGKRYKLDWRLLAAVGYQESHWKPLATSPTGVRGIMMLTKSTAKQLKVTNRLDPEQSIHGGAKYLNHMLSRIPDRIPDPDRTWFALAAYNVGFYHLEDARKLTEARGGDPDKWVEVKKDLPKLSQKKYYQHLKYGYARGKEPVTYVENIRIYHDLLVWSDDKEQALRNTPNVRVPEVNSAAF